MNNLSKHIQRGDITVKSKKQSVEGGVSKASSRSQKEYQLYLQSGSKNKPIEKPVEKPVNKPVNKSKEVSIQRNHKPKNESTIRIIKQANKKKSKHKFTRKKPSKIKDINEIEKSISNARDISNARNISNAREVKGENDQSNISNARKVKGENDQRNIKRNTKRSLKRHSQRSTHKHKKNSRKISIKHKKVSVKEIDKVEKKIASIRNKNPTDIRKELEKEGIKVSGKSNRLLKDIYFYSKVCNIQIQHEK